MSSWFEELASAPKAELERLLRQGQPPDLDALVDNEFRGFNVGRVPALMVVQKFIKGFIRGAEGVEGYNVRVQQNGLTGEWLPKADREGAGRFGYFLVTPPAPSTQIPTSRHPSAALLDYDASTRNPRWKIERLLRDYVVVPYPEHPDILLGKAYIAFGGVQLPVAFFIIERIRPATWQP